MQTRILLLLLIIIIIILLLIIHIFLYYRKSAPYLARSSAAILSHVTPFPSTAIRSQQV